MPYFIKNEYCDACGSCYDVCMNNAVMDLNDLYLIDPNWCLECGSCAAICHNSAIGYSGLDLTPEVSEKPFDWIEQVSENGYNVFT